MGRRRLRMKARLMLERLVIASSLAVILAVIAGKTWRNLAGMDGNRTHPGRLNSAPQTVLKTAEGTSLRTSPARKTPG